MKVDSIDDLRLEPFLKVRDRDVKREDGLFIGEGPLTVEKMLSVPGVTKSILVADRWEDRFSRAESDGVDVLVAPKSLISQVVGFSFHRGVIATGLRAPFKNRTLDEVLPEKSKPATLLLIDEVNNVDNIGLLFRNAAAFACDGVIPSQGCCDPLYRKSLRVSLGHVLSTPWTVSANWQETLTQVAECGIATVAAALEPESISLNDFLPPKRVALIVGQERHGVSEASKNGAEVLLKIPMARGVDSLNVAAASAVCLHHLTQGVRG